MLIAVIDEILRYMAAVAVNNEQAPIYPVLGLGVAIKHLLKPGKAKIVVRPAIR